MRRAKGWARAIWLAALTLPAAATASCGTTDFTKAPSGDAGADGSTTQDATTADAPLADASDGGTKLDASDAAVISSPCGDASTHDLCDDFDQGGGGLAGFWTASATPDASVMRMFVKYASPPGSLMSEIPAFSGGTRPEAKVTAPVPPATGVITCAFDLYVDTRDNAASVSILGVNYALDAGTGFANFGAILRIAVGGQAALSTFGTRLAEAGSTNAQLTGSIPPTQQWIPIRVSVSTGSADGGGRLTLQMGDAAAQQTSIQGPATATDVTLRLGIEEPTNPSTMWRLYYDNIVCDR